MALRDNFKAIDIRTKAEGDLKSDLEYGLWNHEARTQAERMFSGNGAVPSIAHTSSDFQIRCPSGATNLLSTEPGLPRYAQ